MREPDTKNRIILVEDDQKIGDLLVKFLRAQGFETQLIRDGRAAIPVILRTRPELVILDKGLPSIDGIEVCKQLRFSFQGPILMLTAQDGELTEVTALQSGIDDFLTKPVRPRILLARIDALLRRRNAQAQEAIHIGDLTVDRQSTSATWQGTDLGLSSAEFEVLSILADYSGVPVSRDELFWRLRGKEYNGKDRSMDMRIAEVRSALRAVNAPEMIISLRGKGYVLRKAS